MTFILDEDEALKSKIAGYTIVNPGDNSNIPVPVWFRFPDIEERKRSYPHIAIDLVEIAFAADRAHRSEYFYYETNAATPQLVAAPDMPLPWSLMYQVATYARQPRQDRQLTALMYQLFPQQFGFLDMTNIDGTMRRADLVNSVRRDLVDSNKNVLYRNVFTIAVSSELYLYQVEQVQQITSINIVIEYPTTISS